MNIQPIYSGSKEAMWRNKLSKRASLNGPQETQSFESEQDVKIEYINAYEEQPAETPSIGGVTVEKVEASDRKAKNSNLNDYNVHLTRRKLEGDFGRKEDIFGGNQSEANRIAGSQGVTSLIEKFESKMMQNIHTTYTEVLNEISKSMNRIQVLAKDNAEYQEDCLRTNVSEISRHLKIFPKRCQPLQIDEDNTADKNDSNQNIADGEEDTELQPNDIFFNNLEKEQKLDLEVSSKIKEEPYEQNYIEPAPEEPEVEEYLPIFNDTTVDDVAINDRYKTVEDSFVAQDTREEEASSKLLADKDWICKVCKNNFSSKFALQRHQKRNLTCSAAIKELKAKEEEKTENKKASLPKQFLFKSHTKISPDVPYKPCFFCHHAFQRITELIGHLHVIHPNENLDQLADMLPSLRLEDLKPDIIRKRLNDEIYVKDESPNEFDGSLSSCSFCPNESASFSRLMSHVRYVHPDADKSQGHWSLKIFFGLEEKFPSIIVPCNECGTEVKLDNLCKHQANHKQKMKACPECGKSYPAHTYSMHLKTHIEQEWLCNECGKSSKTQRTHKRHMATHDPNFKGFECEECKKVFYNKDILMNHITLVHDKTKRFMCQHCSYVAGSSGNMNFHIRRVHSKEKPSQCDQCDYKTIGNNELVRHVIAVHERDKHFKCDVCAWTTPRKHLMDMHNRLNCKKPPFTEEDREKSKAILAAEAASTGQIYFHRKM